MTPVPPWFPLSPERPPGSSQRSWLVLVSLGLASLLAVLVLFGPLPASLATSPVLLAQSIQDLQNKQKNLNQQRRQIDQQQDQLEQRQHDSEANLKNLQQNITYTANQISETEYRLAQARKKLDQFEKQLKKTETDYERVRSATVGRLQFLQRQQASEGWAVLLQSQDLNQFLDRQYQLKRVYAADRQVLEDLKVKAEAIRTQKATVENQKNQVALLRQQLLSQKQEYEAEATEENQLIDRLQQQRDALEAAETQLLRDSEQLAGLIRQRLAAQSGIVRGTGRFIFPANAAISSGFGNRVHPILGYSRFHAGVDFSASYGSTIRAADSGRVIFSGWYGGYGQAVVIDHGNGLSTLYAHASRLFVREGQTVEQGQPVATVGSTGLSTGPHLHFEVRRNGNPVNPMGYL
ncbi:MAG: murein hydrolase activator EnvC family protein [Nodosilinea sp.]